LPFLPLFDFVLGCAPFGSGIQGGLPGLPLPLRGKSGKDVATDGKVGGKNGKDGNADGNGSTSGM
jgi:hypothetical protein